MQDIPLDLLWISSELNSFKWVQNIQRLTVDGLEICCINSNDFQLYMLPGASGVHPPNDIWLKLVKWLSLTPKGSTVSKCELLKFPFSNAIIHYMSL